MNILFIATESVPYCKTGGVADVVRGLARELYVQGHDVRVVIPCYRGVLNRKRMEEIVPDLSVSLGAYFRKAIVWKANDQPMTYLIDHYFYFDRDNLYGYLDDYERFIFFTRATLEMLSHPAFQQKENNWLPQIIQGFDWVTGFIPFWLSDYGKDDPMFASSRFVLSIQNIKDVGIFGNRTLRIAIPQEKSRKFFPQIGEENERISFLGRGILFADKLVTVNPEYGAQNPLPESAQHLASAIADRVRQGNFVGIHNAIDYKQYDPSEDPHIDTHFKEYSLANRVKNKLKLQQEFGFEQGGRIPMIGMVSQLIPEKGFDLFPGFKEQLLDAGDVQFIALLEPGNPLYTTMFYTWEQEWREQKGNQKPWRKLAFGFDERLARRIYAGCDILLFPFKEDQCGAQQFIAMRYGAILVVHETGALRDAVMHYKPGMNLDNCKGQGVGFSFTEFTSEAFIEAVRSAIDLYNRDQQTWDDIQRHNMREDFSWFQPAKLYLQVYQDVLRTKRIGIENGEPLQLNRDAQLLQTLLEIDSLPGLHVRNPQAMLKQAARLVRETIQCDAVYVWTVGEGEQASFEYLGSQKIQLVSQSLDHHETRMPPDEETLNKLLNQGTMGTLKRFIDLDRSRICQPIPNLYNSKSKKYDSKWAEKEHWMYGWSVPITAHLRVLGRIDVLFRQKLEPHDYEWITRALATIANSFGFRLEQIRLAEDADQISETAKELLNVQSITEAIRKVIERAKHFSYADDAWLYLLADNDLKPTEPSTRAEAGTEIAKTAFAKKEVVYITDLTTVPYEHKEGLRPVHSLMAIPLMNLENKALGVLVLAKEKPAAFSREKEQALINYFAPQAAAALQTNQWHEQRDQNRVDQLKKLAASLIGGGDFNRLLEDVVTTTAEILESQAASLYLVNKDTGNLEIKAAAGYHKPLLDKNVFYYSRGEKGITSWIWKEGRIFKADSLEELHGHPAWAGKTKDLQGREPNAYLGIPLKIVDRKSNEEHVIGVLKFEDRKESWSRHSFIFTEEDVHLGKMMANIIATVVYNTQLSEEQLRELSTNLGKLSGALAGSQDTQTLMDNIVNTIAEVLHVDAASLYLANEDSTRLVIQAASGYQKPLVAAGAFYEWGEGVTGRIAQTKMPFQANELKVLREKGGSEKGKWDHLQENKRPVSFYGLPLRVQGRDKPIGVLKAESLKYRPFTIEDVSLIEMMGNVIATVVYNAQTDRARIESILKNLGSIYKPKPSAAQIILEKFARSLDRGTLELLATILSATIGADKERAYNEAIALLKIAANPELYTYIADASQEDVIQRRFRLFYQVLRTKGFAFEQLGKAFEVSHQWLKLEEESSSSDHFGKAVEAFMQIFKMACKAEIISQNTLDNWWGILLDTSQTFENTYLPAKLAFAFHLNGLPQEQDLEALRNLLAKPFGNQQHVVLPLWCEEEEFVRTRTMLRNKLQQTYSIDTIVIDIEQIQRIVGASQPDIELQRVILPRISLLSISPYKIVGPTDAQIFFGREQELRQIGANVHKTSFAVIGGRRIGKTSILHQLHFVRLPAIGFRTVLYEPSPDSSEVTYEMFLAENIRSWRPEPPSKPPLTFGELLRITHSDKPLVLLLDEADKFVPADRAKGWPLFNALRALLNLRHAQIVLSGEHALREAFRDPDSPLANFANEILLGPLDFQAVEELITQPMKQLEIDLVDKKSIVDRIWAFTSGHPSVVQRLCGRLIDRLNDRLTEQAIRCITQDDVNSIIEEPKFQREDFLDIYCSMFKVFV
jgi:starch synthase